MLMLGPLGFTFPWLLVALAALPILWLILRAVPPAPIRRRFPGVALLLGLRDETTQTDRTPWWLLLLRMLAVAAVIAGFAGPVLNPEAGRGDTGPLLIVADGTWADARDWDARVDRIATLLDDATRAGRPTALVLLSDPPPDGPLFQDAATTAAALPAFTPRPWEPVPETVTAFIATLDGIAEDGFDTVWLSDGLARDSRGPLLDALRDRGSVTVLQAPRQIVALRPARFEDGAVIASAVRTPVGPEATQDVAAIGRDPAGIERTLATATLTFPAGSGLAEVTLDLPPELRNRVTRFELPGLRSAGAVSLADDALRRREIGLIAGGGDAEGSDLLSPLHYLRQALEPSAEIIEGGVTDLLPANPDVIILADVATLAPSEAAAVEEWVQGGGLLVRFAGPRLAAVDHSPTVEDPLLPVILRAGGRSVGGAMSWGEPKTLDIFAETSPFFGLPVPDDVAVTAQVVAQPGPDLADRVVAQLTDGTPLVTRKALGEGTVVLFHVTANAEWSTLPLSGLFVQMLERLAISARPAGARPEDLAGTTWVPEDLLDAFGRLDQVDTLPGIAGERLAELRPGPDLPPGLYAGEDRRIAVNVGTADTMLAPAAWPEGVTVAGLEAVPATDLKGWLLAGAVGLLLIDVIATLALSGRLRGPVAAALLAALVLPMAPEARAQDSDTDTAAAAVDRDRPQPFDDFALAATTDVVLAHVLTGDDRVDELASAGLLGLSQALFSRTAIEPAAPVGVDLERDELTFFPFLYWPVTADQPIPSAQAYDKLNRYLRSGGMILFDTRDADLGGFGSSSAEGRMLQTLAAPLDIPPIEPLPPDHVLTRTFYLLEEFPGRHTGRELWVEAAPPDAELVEGMPFRNLNDGVTPVVIGGNDWAAAWAVDEFGQPLTRVGRGIQGERQREMALRFGINLIMHVLTGNYKSDQVHVPALLDRLGQ